MVRNAWSSADALRNVGRVQDFLNSSVVGAPRVWTLSDKIPTEPTGRVCEMGRCLSGPGSLAPPARRFNGTTCPASAPNCAPLAHDEWLANVDFWTKNVSKVGELIFATTNTVLKKSTAQSGMLPPSELLRVHEGFPCRLLAPKPWASYWLCKHGGELKTDDSDTAVQQLAPVSHIRPLRTGFYFTDLSSGQIHGALLARVEEIAPLSWRRFQGNPTGIAPGVVLGHGRSGWDAGGQEGTSCLQVRETVYCYTMGDRLGWSVKTQAGHGHAIGLVVSLDGGVHFQHWSNTTNSQCTSRNVPFECCTGADSGTCNHGNPMIIGSTKNGSWTAGGGSCDVTRQFGCVGTPNVMYDEEETNSTRRWKMWYVGSTHDHTQVGFATSPDGISWSENPNPVFDMQAQSYIKEFCLRPGVCGGNGYMVVRRFEGTYYMFFAPMGNAMGLATAGQPEGPWEAYSGNPILTLKRTACPNPTSDWPLGYDVYEEGGEYRMIVGCLNRKNRIPCPGGATSHPVEPIYATARSPEHFANWTFDLAHSPLLNRSTNRSAFDYCSYASIQVMPVFKGVPVKHDDVTPRDGDGGGIAVPAAALSSQITHFVFISHPLLYEGMPAATIAKTNAGIYQVWERAVKATSLASIGALAPSSFVVQLNGGSDAFVTAATAKLGASQVLKLGAAGPSDEAPADPSQWLAGRAPINFTAMYEGFAIQTKTYLSQHGLTFDPATATSEFWGESFEGCVPGYGSGWATAMGLQTKGVMMFDHTVADARFMYRAVHTETVSVGGSDVEAMVFRLVDNASVACVGPPFPPSEC